MGVHTGAPATVRLHPAVGSGLTFGVGPTTIPARLGFATAIPGATVLAREGVQIRTVEHLLAALSGLGLTDLRIEVEGPELPVLDGSAQPWVEALNAAGRVEQPDPAPCFAATRRITVDAAGGTAILEPADAPSLEVHVAYPDGPTGSMRTDFAPGSFERDIAPARTFVLASQIEALRAAGRGRGATRDNTIVWDGQAPEGLRFPDEPVRHKLLDAMGDLALVGRIRGRVVIHRGSHELHHALLHAARDALKPG